MAATPRGAGNKKTHGFSWVYTVSFNFRLGFEVCLCLFPVDYLPKRLDVVNSAVLVLKVVGMF